MRALHDLLLLTSLTSSSREGIVSLCLVAIHTLPRYLESLQAEMPQILSCVVRITQIALIYFIYYRRREEEPQRKLTS